VVLMLSGVMAEVWELKSARETMRLEIVTTVERGGS